MNCRNVDKQKQPAIWRLARDSPNGAGHLIGSRIAVCDAKGRLPVTFSEQPRQDGSQGAGAIEESNAADADRVVALPCESRHDVGSVEDERFLGSGLTAREASRKQSWVPAGPRG